MSNESRSMSRGEKLMVALGVLLAGNLALTLAGIAGATSSASAQVQSFGQRPQASEAGAGGGPVSPTTSVQVLSRLGDQMAEMNQRLDRIERKLDGELRVKVTSMPAQAQPKQ